MVSAPPRQLFAELCLWLFVITLSLQMGAGLYELRVVTPLWAAAPPASVREWNRDARRAIEPRARFWRYCTAAVGLSALCALISGWVTGGRRRVWLVGSAFTALALVLATYLYFAPALAQLLEARGAGLSDGEIERRVSEWLWLSRARAAAYVAAWLAALWAFRASAPEPESAAPRI